MSVKALVIGYGSIGKRHAKILNEMTEISQVSVLSSQHDLPFDTITSLEEIPMMNLDYVVVASSTALHREQLAFLEKNLWGRLILVEKPLFNEFYDLKIRNNRVFVGYNLRFHPLLQKIRKAISGRRLWNIQAFCGSYLPDWRPKRDYRETSSAKKDAGGGVLLDLSHELDYVRWLAGSIEVKHAVSVTVSDLDISSDDLLFVSGKTKEGAYVHITLNYFTRQPLRQILIDGKDISIRADLISNSLSVIEDGEASDNSWPDLERSDTYRSQHRAVLEDDLSSICTFAEGLETMRLIDRVRSFSNS